MSMPVSDKDGSSKNPTGGRPWIGMHFSCCNTYRRIYLTHDGSAFAGHCPKCARPVRIPVSEQGESGRFWSAD